MDPRTPSVGPVNVTLLSTPTERLVVEQLVTLRLRLENVASEAVSVALAVSGLPAGWLLYPADISLAAGQVKIISVTVSVPRRPDASPTLRRLCLDLSTSGSAWRWQHCDELLIEPFYDIDLTLKSVAAGRGWGTAWATYSATLTNASNVALPLSVVARSQGGATVNVGDEASSHGRAMSDNVALTLPAGGQHRLIIRLAQRGLSPFAVTSLPLNVSARYPAIPALIRHAEQTVALPPRIAARNVTLTAMGALLLLCILALGARWLNPNATAAVAPTPVATATAQAVYMRRLPTVTPERARIPVNDVTRQRQLQGRERVVEITPNAETELTTIDAGTLPPAPNTPSVAPSPDLIIPPTVAPPDEEKPDGADAAGGVQQIYALPAIPDQQRPVAPESYEQLIQEVARYYNIDWRVVAAVVYHESRVVPTAAGAAGEMGLMQIMPATWGMIEAEVQQYNPWDPYANLMIGTYFLRAMQEQFGTMGYPEPYWSLAAYNWGPTNLSRHLAAGGSWEELPYAVQLYAWRILTDATDPTADWWQNELLQPVVYP